MGAQENQAGRPVRRLRRHARRRRQPILALTESPALCLDGDGKAVGVVRMIA